MVEAKNNFVLLASLIGILGLLLGVLFGANLFPIEKIVEKEVIKECPVCQICPVCPVATEKTIEVEKIVNVEIEKDYAGQAIATLLENLEDEELDVCGGDQYDLDQVIVSKAYDEFSYKLLKEKDNKYEITAKVKLKYLDKDTEEKCYKTLDFKVTYEDGEDDVIEIL